MHIRLFSAIENGAYDLALSLAKRGAGKHHHEKAFDLIHTAWRVEVREWSRMEKIGPSGIPFIMRRKFRQLSELGGMFGVEISEFPDGESIYSIHHGPESQRHEYGHEPSKRLMKFSVQLDSPNRSRPIQVSAPSWMKAMTRALDEARNFGGQLQSVTLVES